MRTLIVGLIAALALTGCAKPLPPDKRDYAGEWTGRDMSLRIWEDGNMKYERRRGSSTTSVEGPIQRFEGNDFLVGVGPISTRFIVSSPPQERNGEWTMTVDGVELAKSDSLKIEI